jgi:hypothetical protein
MGGTGGALDGAGGAAIGAASAASSGGEVREVCLDLHADGGTRDQNESDNPAAGKPSPRRPRRR